MNSIKLFLIPYAVADVSCYDNLIKALKNNSNGNLEIIPIELKSHGARRKEMPYKSIDEAACDVQRIINEKRGNSRIVIYGHCVGGVIAYRLYQNLLLNKEFNIAKLILGSVAVNENMCNDFVDFANNNIKESIKKSLEKDIDDWLIDQIYSYKKPILMQEYNIVKEFLTTEKIVLDSNFVLINGKNDEFFNLDEVREKVENYHLTKHYMVPGEHFFVDNFYEETAKVILEEL